MPNLSKFVVAASMVVSVGAALAQDASPFFGKWKIGPQPRLFLTGSSLELNEAGGSWKNYPDASKKRPDACSSLTAPVSIEEKEPNQMVIRIRAAETVPGCQDQLVKLVLEDKTVKAYRQGVQLPFEKD